MRVVRDDNAQHKFELIKEVVTIRSYNELTPTELDQKCVYSVLPTASQLPIAIDSEESGSTMPEYSPTPEGRAAVGQELSRRLLVAIFED